MALSRNKSNEKGTSQAGFPVELSIEKFGIMSELIDIMFTVRLLGKTNSFIVGLTTKREPRGQITVNVILGQI
jgi:hypothetical protein